MIGAEEAGGEVGGEPGAEGGELPPLGGVTAAAPADNGWPLPVTLTCPHAAATRARASPSAPRRKRPKVPENEQTIPCEFALPRLPTLQGQRKFERRCRQRLATSPQCRQPRYLKQASDLRPEALRPLLAEGLPLGTSRASTRWDAQRVSLHRQGCLCVRTLSVPSSGIMLARFFSCSRMRRQETTAGPDRAPLSEVK